MPLGETFLGAVLNVLFDRLTSPELVQFLRQEGFKTKINKWRMTLEMINAVLGDAEEKQITNKAVKIWLNDLEELAYDAEDMLDEFEYEATARKMRMAELQSIKFWKHVPAGFCNWSLDAIRFRFRMRSKVNEVTARFDRLCQLRQDLRLLVNTEGTPLRSSAAPQRPPTSAHRTEPVVYGRDADKEKILEMVLNDEPNDSNLLVIPIVGMGGVGKTTLAREVYNDGAVHRCFGVKAWICVSDGEFDVTRISKSILESITTSSWPMNDLAAVQDQLKEKVNGKKLLLVLDDVWSSDYGKWQILQSPLTASAVGSRIIVTTRDEGVALRLRPSGFHRVSPLKPEDCWSVFSMCAFQNGAVPPEHHEMELIHRKVIEKSGGLPLVATTLGGLLRSEKIDDWLRVLNSMSWDHEFELGLQVNTGGAPSRSSAAPQRPPTSAHRTEPVVYGRDADKEKILEMVLNDEPNDSNLLVIPIVGMGGVGKTTLAREVYNDGAVHRCFGVKAWICVSDGEFDVTRISKSILESITTSSWPMNDLAAVQDQLKEKVNGKKLLLVLDDVWSSDYGKWQILQSPLTASAVGSRIIVTTRDEGVALRLRPSGFHRVSPLKPEDCWSVFSMCAFQNGAVPPEHHEMELIHRKVIEKSGGLPLVATTLGGLLRSEKIDDWLRVLNSMSWDHEFELGLQVNTGGAPSRSSAAPQRPPTSAHRTEPVVYGRDADKEKILEMVLNDEPNDSNLLVIPIVGMGGVGKTTLAREVYNDGAVHRCFGVKAWICVSDGEFDVTRISKSILESITTSSWPMNDLAAVQDQLKEKVNGKKLLLVLDDVWSSDYGKWQILQSPLTASAVGSRIIVTTRDEGVALRLRPSGFHRVSPLKPEDCWSVFSMCAFQNGAVPPEHHEMELIHRKVIEKSGGLPLVATTLGGLLRSEKIDDWLRVLNSMSWDHEFELGLQVNTGGAPSRSSAAPQRPPTSAHRTEPVVYGRDADKEKILEMVLNDEPNDSNLLVIPIVGMGGVGKTTLAREVYNDGAVHRCFGVKAWICVSDGEFDVTRISKSILESITTSSWPMNDLAAVQDQLKEKVNGKKLLLVLDDVWSSDYGKWQILQSPLTASAVGSRIIVTTRDEGVALRLRPSGFHRVSPLKPEDCWSVFSMCAFQNGAVPPEHHEMELIHRKVIEKSGGLPLVATTLGGLLRSEKIDDWLRVLNSMSWDHEFELGLQVNTGGAPSRSSAAPQRPPTSAHRTEPVVYGRDADKEKILEMVLNDEPNDSNLLVIPIVGMGGVGKTTLAREVYNDGAVHRCFGVKAWICVSDGEFDVTRISKSILESITTSSWPMNDLAAVQDQLKEKVNGKKLLLVLDDVWSSDYGKWQILQSPLTASAVGSRIIVTTRDEGVALRLRPNGFHRLDLLQREDCWLVFCIHAFEKGAVPEHHEMELIREKVIEKSDGLPLAAKTLGGLLRAKKIDEWLVVLNSELWNLLENDGSEISAALKLSYHHLPSHLRRCFAYCAIFPKDHGFEIEDVVLLWIAEGLVQQSTEDEQLEKLGYQYFFDLLQRSMFQRSSSNNGHKFVMHSLVYDLAQWAFGERGLRLDSVSAANGQLGGLKEVLHFSYTSVKYDGEKRFKVFQEVEGLTTRIRTFFLIPQDDDDKYITNSVPFDLLSKLKRLRVLSLQTYCIVEVPIPIGGLKHLRYLNLSSTKIGSLPESTSLLYNLQILLLRDCSRLVKLPSNFKYLIRLRHLDIKGAILIKEMPLGMEKLQSLQKLSNFIVGKGVCPNLKDLMSLNMLHGELCISGLDNVISCDQKILRDKKDLEELLLEWGSQFHVLQREDTEEKVLDMLQPHENLRELTITCYGGTKFPPWVGAASYFNMKVLRLEYCERCTYLPSLGVLVSLEELTIKGMKGLKRISSEFYGNGPLFKSLKTLCFKDLLLWTDWEPIEENEYGDAFPCLEMLSIERCPNLSRSLPRRLFALEELVIENCEQLVVSLSNIPKLCKIYIQGCKTIACNNPMDFKSIRHLTLSKISKFSNQLMQECFGKAELQQIKYKRSEVQLDESCPEKPLVGGLQSIRFLTELVISDCSNIVSFPEVCCLPYLSKLQISYCNALISLPKEMKIKNACLESLDIWRCDSLAFIVKAQLPPSLKRISIDYCEKLESLWDDRKGSCSSREGKENGNNTNSSLLEYLRVFRCPSLTCLSSIIQLPATLKHLEFIQCPQLSTITEGFHDPSTSLEVICIRNCKNLQMPNGLHNLRHLQHLTIWGCPTIECFPEEGLADTNLRELEIGNCEKLKVLPVGLRSLNSLEDLIIAECPSITSFNPEEEFPTNLKSLQIRECVNVYRPLVEWGLHNLTSLTSFQIQQCPHVESFPQQEMEMMLPPSLTHLSISSFSKLEQLWSQGFLNLTSLQSLTIRYCSNLTSLGDQGLPPSLKYLEISDCPKLTCFPKQGLPSLLESLEISDCPKLTCFPDQGLPSSLHTLKIYDCLKLKEECKRYKGREWSKISNILEVIVDHRHIFELEDEEAQSSSSYRSCLTNPMHCCKL